MQMNSRANNCKENTVPVPRSDSLPVLDCSQSAACLSVSAIVHEMSESFGRAIDAKDPHTKSHSDEVSTVAHALALTMGLSAHTADVIHIAAHLHDIGKIGVPDNVLTKTTSLTEEDWQLIRRHPADGAAILAPIHAMSSMGVPTIVLCHHERFDGTGYPQQLCGEAIPLGARIIAVADSLSAMLQHRPYRRNMTFEAACAEIRRCAGTQFDPSVVEAFDAIQPQIWQLLCCLKGEPGATPAFTASKPDDSAASGL